MNPLVTSFIVFVGIFGVGIFAMLIRSLLPEHHRSADTKDTVKLAMALVATMTALLLGLMIASAKGTFDAQKTNIVTTAAKIVVLDRMLKHYGQETANARDLVRNATGEMIIGLWPDKQSEPFRFTPDSATGDAVYEAIQNLSPQDDAQRVLKTSAMSNAVEIGNVRWLLVAQSGSSIALPLLVVVVGWLGVLFFSFGLFAPANGTAISMLLISALSVAGAIFLILELDQPFDGLIHISSEPMQMAATNLGK